MLITEKNSETNATYQQQGIKRGADKTNKQDKKARWNNDAEESSGEGSDSADSEEEITPNKTKQQNVDEKKGSSKENEFEVVPVEDNSKFKGPFCLSFFFFTARLANDTDENCLLGTCQVFIYLHLHF